jgi:CheY-like chemotaxis protein/anti-sigma regulatory factor (Ser/Thr protein kinase)
MESGNQQYNMEHCPLDSLVMEVVNHFRHDKRHQVIFLDEARDVSVNADRERMIQVLTNLMSNAIKFSPEGGRVTIRLSNEAENVICSIEDKGIGIPKHELPMLFQKFKRIDNSASRKIGGTGLGLAICKEIVAKHNGSIWIESEEGQGTTIYFSLPLASIQVISGAITDEAAAGKESPSRGNVMIVEDDMSLALLLSEELKMHSFKVIHHYNPNFALEDALKTKLVGMVVDLMLGDEMDGWDLIRELKSHAETAEIPIVVSSALDQSEEKLRMYNIERYLTKPYPSGELSRVILEFFIRSQGSGMIAFPEGGGS